MTDVLTAAGDEIADDCIVLGNGHHEASEPFTFSAYIVGFPHAIRTKMTQGEFEVLRTVLLRAAHENKLSIKGEILSTRE